jgi:hypothetical protein
MMRRTIGFALFALLLSVGAAFPQSRTRTVVFVRPTQVIVVPQFLARPAGFHRHNIFTPFSFPVGVPLSDIVPPTPNYVYGDISASHPQLVFNDGTTYTVTDYWRVDDQLHFVTSEDGGTKSVPRVVPFSQLDVQRTTNADKALGFRFVIRNEPIAQWLEHHH